MANGDPRRLILPEEWAGLTVVMRPEHRWIVIDLDRRLFGIGTDEKAHGRVSYEVRRGEVAYGSHEITSQFSGPLAGRPYIGPGLRRSA